MRQACTNSFIRITELEDRVLAGVRKRLMTPALITRFAGVLQQALMPRTARPMLIVPAPKRG